MLRRQPYEQPFRGAATPPSPLPGVACGDPLAHVMACAAPLPPIAAARVLRKRLAPPLTADSLAAGSWLRGCDVPRKGLRGSETGRAGFSVRAASGGPRGLPSPEAVLSRTHLPLPVTQL